MICIPAAASPTMPVAADVKRLIAYSSVCHFGFIETVSRILIRPISNIRDFSGLRIRRIRSNTNSGCLIVCLRFS
jgi:NADH:ubiquinone oxidoreductase subunit 4 (subunit M)